MVGGYNPISSFPSLCKKWYICKYK